MARLNVALNSDEDHLLAVPINFSNIGDNIIITGLAGRIIRVYRYFLVVGGTVNLTYKDGANALTGAIPLVANEAMVFTFDTKPWYLISPGNNFVINSSVGGVQVSGAAYYTQDQA